MKHIFYIFFIFNIFALFLQCSESQPRKNVCMRMHRALDRWWNEDNGPVIRSEDYPQTHEFNIFALPLDQKRRDFRRAGTLSTAATIAVAAALPTIAIPALTAGAITAGILTLPLLIYPASTRAQ